MWARLCLSLLLFILLAPQAVRAQAVQLPTFNYFTVNTTVLAPDRGSAYLGGVNRASIGSNESGAPLAGKLPGFNPLFRSQGIGQQFASSQARVHATIIDLDEMDKAILAQAAAQRGQQSVADDALRQRRITITSAAENRPPASPSPGVQSRAEFISRNISRNRVASGR